jgi:CubicO group peptidase (beta-lactamase class C family)
VKNQRVAAIVIVFAVFVLSPFTACAALAAPAADATGPVKPASEGSLTAIVTAAEKAGFAGVVLAGDRSKISFEKSVGLADRSRRTPHSPDMVWRWASISKQITATVAAQLVSEGKLDLEKPVSAYLNTKEFTGPNAKLITIRQLLQHTSGLPNPSDPAPGATAEAAANSIPPFYLEEVLPETVNKVSTAGACSATPKRSPGEQFEYNNCDYFVLGAVIEKITGQAMVSVIAERIAKPLNLTKGAIRPANSKDKYAQPVKGYDGKRLELTFNLATYGAAGALLGTPRDLFTIDQALLGDTLMSPEMKKQFWKGEPKLGYAALGVWSFPTSLKGCKDAVSLIERRGAIGGIQVRNFLAPQLGRALIVFTNLGDWDFGEVWQGNGFSYDLLNAAFCSG